MFLLVRKVSGFAFVSLALLATLSLPASALSSNAVYSYSQDEALANELLNYANLDANGNILGFDANRAKLNGASEIVINAANSYNTQSPSAGFRLNGASTQVSFPVHGNWCGPGHSGPGTPIDLLDTRCQTHDRCYAKNGYFNKSCDRTLVALITIDLNQNRYS